MPDGSVVFQAELDNSKLERELAKVSKRIESIERSISGKKAAKSGWEESAKNLGAELDSAKMKLAEMKDAAKGAFSSDQISDQKEKIKPLQSQWNEAQGKVEKYTGQIDRANKRLEEQKTIASQLIDSIEAENERLRAIADSAIVSNRHIIDLKKELDDLKSRQNDLRKAGVTEGYEEYEANARRIAEINRELKEYRANLASIPKDTTVAPGDGDIQANLQNTAKAAEEVAEKTEDAAKSTGKLSTESGGAAKGFNKLLTRVSKLASRAVVFSMITAGLRSLRSWMGDVIQTNDAASSAIARLKGALLTMAQPIVDVVIPAFTTLLNLLSAIIGKVAAFISALGGKSVKQSADAAKSLNKESKAIGDVGSAAKDAKKQLAGFDEINRMESTDSGGGGGGGGVSSEIQPDFNWVDGITETLDEIADIVLLIGAGFALWKIGGMLPGVLGTVATTLGLILITIGGLLIAWNGLADAWENGVDWVNLTEMVGGLAAAAFGLYQLFGPIAAGILLIVGGLAMLVTGFHDAMENGWNLQNTLLSIAGVIATGLGITLLTGSLIPLLVGAIASLLLALTVATGHGDELIQGIQDVCQGFVDFITGIFSGDMDKALGGIEQMFRGLRQTVGAVIAGVRDTILSFLDWLDEKTNGKFHGIIEFIKSFVTSTFESISSAASGAISGIQEMLEGIVKFISSVFSGDWEAAWEGVQSIFKGAWNGIVSVLESAVNLVIEGINWMISQLNRVSFTLPGWVPAIGGKSFGFNISPISQVSIPRLAQGAVIPPNREFLAVLGDQRHGTNIEAPLETIQEAVALVMNDFIDSNMAGHEATVGVLREILAAVLGIEIGDEVIAQAVNRYNRKMAVVNGGSA